MRQLGLCSWSGKPSNPADLVSRLDAVSLKLVQLAIDPVVADPVTWGGVNEALSSAGVTVASGMLETLVEDYSSPARIRETGGLVPDEAYASTLARLPAVIGVLKGLGVDVISFHAGFIPHDPADPDYEKILGRLRTFADLFASDGISLILETGQETADTLVALLGVLDRPNVGVNFDPGNMLLYSMGDPIDALRKLLPHIHQVHIKDAIASGDPEVWGTEMPAGEGQVPWREFFDILAAADYSAGLIIEREAGDQPTAEIRRAVDYLSGLLEP